MISKLLKDSSGATAIEYAFICAFLVLVAIAGMTTLGAKSTSQINNVSDKVDSAMK